MFHRTKIVCTIGPAVSSYEKIVELIEAGMSVARLNFSHGTHKEHERTIGFLKKARQAKKVPLTIMLDTHGPKIRVGKLKGDAIALKPKQKLTLGKGGIPVEPFEALANVKPGMKILFDDGYIVSKVVEKKAGSLVLEILNSGTLKSGKGLNVPGADVPLPALTDQDVDDLKFGCKHDVDYVAASFIRSADHIKTIKKVLAKEGKPEIRVIAKIESAQGVANFDAIMEASDGIMVARGDLGVEVDLAEVPPLQKMMIRKCAQSTKPVVTATQMLESMIVNPRPTRAEVSDVANAIYDSTSCIMLSGETAVGKYPIETVEWMRRIAYVAEADFDYRHYFDLISHERKSDIPSAIALAAVQTAYSSGAKCIFVFTATGQTARLLSALRPSLPIIAVTPSAKVYNQLAFNWGISPILAEDCKTPKEAFAVASAYAKKAKFAAKGDMVIEVVGTPFGKQGTTNCMMVERLTS